MSIETQIRKTRERLLALASKLSFLAPFLMRVSLAAIFIVSGWGKLHTLDKVTEYFASLNIPMPGLNARVAASTEFFGGVLLLVGLGSRLVALPMAFTMVIAIITAKRADIDGVVALVSLDEWVYLVMLLSITLIGPGAL